MSPSLFSSQPITSNSYPTHCCTSVKFFCTNFPPFGLYHVILPTTGESIILSHSMPKPSLLSVRMLLPFNALKTNKITKYSV